jgi:hypothetical protein
LESSDAPRLAPGVPVVLEGWPHPGSVMPGVKNIWFFARNSLTVTFERELYE